MGDWPSGNGLSRVQCAIGTPPAPLTIDTADGANTKSASWIELIAATSFDGLFGFYLGKMSWVGDALVDIAVGAAGSENIIINNALISQRVYTTFTHYPTQIAVPAGSRISAKVQSTYSGVNTIRIAPVIAGVQSFLSCEGHNYCDTYGAATADSGGTQIDPGASSSTYGAWVPVAASLTRPIKGFFIVFGGRNNSAPANYNFAVDISIGAEGSEIAIVSGFHINTYNATHDGIGPKITPYFPFSLPASTRIAVRAMCSGNDATDRLFDVVLYTFS